MSNASPSSCWQLCIPLLVLLAGGVRAQARQPNIVYIMADELGYYELSCMGHPRIRTPRIDRMAAEGIRFTQALAGSPLCAPTRCTLMTGKHTGHSSVRSNGGGTPLRAEEETIASVLGKAGYATGGFGKWGCGGRGSTGVPEKHGFDTFVGYYDQVHAHSYYPAYIIRNSQEMPLAGNQGGRTGQTYSHYVIHEEAKAFIRKNAERPFFCYLPYTPPHGMFDIPNEDPAWKLYSEQPWPEDARRYAAMVTMIDRQVGEILDLLSELDLERDTLVFFCGDNGGNDYFRDREHPRGFHGPNVDPRTGVAFRGHKGNLYEGGLRIPMIARWPDHISAGRVSQHVWYFPDVLPTLAELARAETPADTDGLSIVPELLGEDTAGREQEAHEYLYWELGGQVAVRMGSWKAIRPRRKVPWELYDLSQDPSEAQDLAADHPEILGKMEAFAAGAHQPVVEGTFEDRTDHDKDRRAKWGPGEGPKERRGKAQRMSDKGLLPRGSMKIVRVSSESTFNGKLAGNAIDGDPRTFWHTRWQGSVARAPHSLVIDLGKSSEVQGIRYLPRQDSGWNGAIKTFRLYVGDSATTFGNALAAGRFTKTRKAQEFTCPPTRGRYLKLEVLSEISGGPWGSIAELGIIGTR